MNTSTILRPDDFFVLFGCGLSLVMALGLIMKPRNPRKIILALILVSFAYIQLSSVLMSSGLIYSFAGFMFTPVPLGSLIGPLFYLYGDTFLHDRKTLGKKDIPVFIPPLVLTIMTLPYLLMPVEKKVQYINGFYSTGIIFKILVVSSMVIFVIFITLTILRIRNSYHRKNPLHAHLFFIFWVFLSWILLVIFKVVGMMTMNVLLWRISNALFALCVIAVYLLLQRKPFLYNYVHLSGESGRNVSKNGFTAEEAEALEKEITMLMEEEKLFCDEDLSLGRMAHALEISPHQLSAFINDHYRKNFNTFVNGYRVEYARELIESDPGVSTLSVAFASGFNSYSSFYSTFKKMTASSPGDYKNNLVRGKK